MERKPLIRDQNFVNQRMEELRGLAEERGIPIKFTNAEGIITRFKPQRANSKKGSSVKQIIIF